MRVLFMTSTIDTNTKDKNGNQIPQKFSNFNHLIDNLKKYVKKFDNFLYIASAENGQKITDAYFDEVKNSFQLTMPFKNYVLLDGRNKDKTRELVKNADFIFLAGGHVPTENKFFSDINLREIIKDSQAVIMGASAGSMTVADVVYCPPEIEGEGVDKSFKRYLKGLNLTKINIFPHFSELKNQKVDGLEYVKDILIPDSFHSPIVAFSDGAYILQLDDEATMFGEAVIFSNGKIKELCKENESARIDERISKMILSNY